MDESPYELILAVFDDESHASDAFQTLKSAEKEHLIDLEDVVVIHKEDEGKIHIKETEESITHEAGLGALVGGALGILAGPLGIITFAATGAILGGISAKLDDVGFDDARLERLGEALEPGKSAIVAVIEIKAKNELIADLESLGAKVATESLPKDIGEQIEKGSGWAYQVAAAEADEAAAELGLKETKVQDFISDVDDHTEDQSADDPNAAFPKL